MSLKVIYIDDEPALCENFSDIFASADVAVTTFTDPTVAIAAIKDHPPDLLFIDYRLPGTNGDEIAQKLDSKIPIYLITGDILVVTNYKFKKIFSKPYKEVEILETIQEYKKRAV